VAITGLVVPVSGPYVGSWDGFALGVQHDDGYELACTIQGQEVNETDQYGVTMTEAIYRGQNWRCRLRGLEWSAGMVAVLKMFGTSGTLGDGLLTPTLAAGAPTPIGDRWTKFTQTLILRAVLGNPPTAPTTLTAAGAGFAPNSESAFNMTSKVRELPLELVLLPYVTVAGSLPTIAPFTTT
jgi:hypothetical protein